MLMLLEKDVKFNFHYIIKQKNTSICHMIYTTKFLHASICKIINIRNCKFVIEVRIDEKCCNRFVLL